MTQEVTAADQAQHAAPARPAVGAEPGAAAQEVAVREVQFASLSGAAETSAGPSLDLIMDLEVDLCAELGRTAMLIRDLMELHPGSIIELHKVVGEPVDLLANGRLIARGEVVVVDETFGVRVTEIVNRGVAAGGAT